MPRPRRATFFGTGGRLSSRAALYHDFSTTTLPSDPAAKLFSGGGTRIYDMRLTTTLNTRALLFGAALTSLSAAATAQGPNLLQNPSFETGAGSPDNWFSFGGGTGIVKNDMQATDGTFSAQSTDPVDPGSGENNGSIAIAQTVTGITAGTEYEYFADVNTTFANDPAFPSEGASLTLAYQNSGGTTIALDQGPQAGTQFPKETITSTGGSFQTFSFVTTAPAGATQVLVYLEYGNYPRNAAVPPFLADNAIFRTTAPPPGFCPGNLLADGQFEMGTAGVTATGGASATNPASGVDGSNALQLEASGSAGGASLVATPGGAESAFEVNFQARTTTPGAEVGVELVSKASGAVLAMRTSTIRGDQQLVNYRLVTDAGANPDEVVLQFNLDDGEGVIVDDVCLLPTTITTPPAVTGNLLPDGDFEMETNPLINGNYTITSDAASGNNSLVVNPSSYQTTSATISGLTPAATGTTDYVFSFDAKRVGTLSFAKIVVTFRDGTGTVVTGNSVTSTSGPVNAFADPTNIEILTASGDFEAGSITFAVQSNVTEVSLEFQAEPVNPAAPTSNGRLVIDNVVFGESTVVPVQLAAFEAAADEAVNVIAWTTASEINTAAFLVERSADGVNAWTEIAEVAPEGGADQLASYEVRDASPIANAYYRLRSVDFDGAEELSNVLYVTRGDNGGGIRAFPNPVDTELTLAGDFPNARDYRLFDVTGRLVRSGTITEGTTRLTVATADLPAGQYYVRIGTETLKFVK